MNIIFKDKAHKDRYISLLQSMERDDCYHKSIAYLFALCEDCFNNITMLYDFEEKCITPEYMNASWQTGTSFKVIKLAYNLFNGYCYLQDDMGEPINIGGSYFVDGSYTPEDIFCCSYAPYFWQAIRLRYPEYCEDKEETGRSKNAG